MSRPQAQAPASSGCFAGPPPPPLPPFLLSGGPARLEARAVAPYFTVTVFKTPAWLCPVLPSAAPVPPLPPDPTLGGRTLRTEAGAHGLMASPGPQPGAWWEPLQGCPRGNSRPLRPSCSSRQLRPPQPSADQRRTAGPFQGPCSLNPGRATEEGTRGASGRGGRGQRQGVARGGRGRSGRGQRGRGQRGCGERLGVGGGVVDSISFKSLILGQTR